MAKKGGWRVRLPGRGYSWKDVEAGKGPSFLDRSHVISKEELSEVQERKQ